MLRRVFLFLTSDPFFPRHDKRTECGWLFREKGEEMKCHSSPSWVPCERAFKVYMLISNGRYTRVRSRTHELRSEGN